MTHESIRVVIIKEKNMKKFTAIIAIMLVVAFATVIFVGCGDDKVPENAESRPRYSEGFGDTSGLTATTPISSDMSAIEMLTAGVENYYNAGYMASLSEGSIDTKVGAFTIVQFVQSMTIRDGSASGDYRQFSDNQSGTNKSESSLPIDIFIWEETSYSRTGDAETIKFHNGDKSDMGAGKDEKTGSYTMFFKDGKTFNATETKNSIEEYKKAYSADPTKIWMYDLTGSTIIEDQCTPPVQNADGDWTFTVVGDPDLSTKEYQEQMMYMLNGQIPGDMLNSFAFTTIKLNVTMSPNGFIKKVDIQESYDMGLKIGILKITVRIGLNSTRYFSYKETETGLTPTDLDEYLARF